MAHSAASPLAPLDEFYAAAGLAPPASEPIASSDVPVPLRALLVHSGPLTARLEHRYQQPLRLRVLERRQEVLSKGVDR